jgi:hypothetical protein
MNGSIRSSDLTYGDPGAAIWIHIEGWVEHKSDFICRSYCEAEFSWREKRGRVIDLDRGTKLNLASARMALPIGTWVSAFESNGDNAWDQTIINLAVLLDVRGYAYLSDKMDRQQHMWQSKAATGRARPEGTCLLYRLWNLLTWVVSEWLM